MAIEKVIEYWINEYDVHGDRIDPYIFPGKHWKRAQKEFENWTQSFPHGVGVILERVVDWMDLEDFSPLKEREFETKGVRLLDSAGSGRWVVYAVGDGPFGDTLPIRRANSREEAEQFISKHEYYGSCAIIETPDAAEPCQIVSGRWLLKNQ